MNSLVIEQKKMRGGGGWGGEKAQISMGKGSERRLENLAPKFKR
jgi:hypothetical protein